MSQHLPAYQNSLSLGNQLARKLWWLVRLFLFLPTPNFLFAWRRFLLRLFGAKLADGVRVYPSARVWAPWNLEMGANNTLADGVDCYCVDRISIGSDVTVSQDAFLCTASHDISDTDRRLIKRPIRIERMAWIFARAFVGPGVTVGEGSVIAACAVVVKDVSPWKVVAGNPAREVKDRVLNERRSSSAL
jgi:putative colanic acid biosynthesis acetyltransferase WcaF